MATETAQNVSRLILASASPRRAALLTQLDIAFDTRPASIDETPRNAEKPHDYVRRLALEKAAQVVGSATQSCVVLAADTAVVCSGRIFGKPVNSDAATEMLSLLSGNWHEVISGVAVIHREATTIAVRTRVKFRDISPAEIDAYWASGEPQDKAGAYGIQGLGGAFVERIEGSYSNVVGLPLVETLKLLREAGINDALRR